MFSLLRFAYGAARRSTVVLVSLTVVGSVSTVLLTYLIGQVVAASGPVAAGGGLAGFGWLLAAMVLVFLVMSSLPVWREVVAVGLEVRLDRVITTRTLTPLMGPRGTAHLEDPEIQDTYAQAGEVDLVTLSRGPAAVASLLGSRLMMIGSLILIGTLFTWWPVPILLVSVAYLEWWFARSTDSETASWAGQTQGQRRASYLYHLAMIEGIHELRIFGLARWLADRHTAERQVALAPLQRLRWRSALVRLGVLAIHIGLYAAAVIYAVREAWMGELSLGAVSAVVPAMLLVGTGYDSTNLANARRSLAAFRAFRTLPRLIAERYPDRPGQVVDMSRRPKRSIRFANVCFRYPGQSQDVLHDFDLEINADEAHALVGVNGAGKSTVVKLLAGCYRPTSGCITVDGIDIATLDPGSLDVWQQRIAAMVQDFLRLPLSASANIACGAVRQQPGRDSVIRAARRAGIDNAVTALPDGWSTILDRNSAGGADLSGGQWQRLALARALLAVEADAGVLVLDEPAAALDVRAESELVQHYLSLTQGVTSVIISHRFSVVRPADRISVLDGGRIVESGTHDELMARAGQYARMFRLQADRYLTTERPAEDD